MSSFRSGPFFLGAAIGVSVGGASVYFVLSRRLPPPPRPVSTLNALGLDDNHPALRYGAPTPTESIRSFDNFIADFDTRTRNPRWVLERINTDIANSNGGAERSASQFFEDHDLDPLFRTRTRDYAGSGYDRGHMAPAANHKSSQRVMDQTFTLANVSPQVGRGFNRDYWGRFEKYVRDLTKSCRDVYVVTGPLWMPNTTVTGPDGSPRLAVSYPIIGTPPAVISVPTHFFKVVLAEPLATDKGKTTSKDRIAIGAFVMPNEAIDPDTPLTAFSVPLERLEAVAGFRIFSNAVSTDHRQALDKAALEWQQVGHKILDAQKRAAGKLLKGSSSSTTQSDPVLALPSSTSDSLSEEGHAASSPKRDTNTSDEAGSKRLFSASEEKALWSPKTRAGGGEVMHLCDLKKCSLPAEEFWNNKGKPKSANK